MFRVCLQRAANVARSRRMGLSALRGIRQMSGGKEPWTREQKMQAGSLAVQIAGFAAGLITLGMGVNDSIEANKQRAADFKRETAVKTLESMNQSESEFHEVASRLFFTISNFGKSNELIRLIYKIGLIPHGFIMQNLLNEDRKIQLIKYIRQQAYIVQRSDSRLATPEFKKYMVELSNKIVYATIAARNLGECLNLAPDYFVYTRLLDMYRLQLTQFIADLDSDSLHEKQMIRMSQMKEARDIVMAMSYKDKETLVRAVFSNKPELDSMRPDLAGLVFRLSPATFSEYPLYPPVEATADILSAGRP